MPYYLIINEPGNSSISKPYQCLHNIKMAWHGRAPEGSHSVNRVVLADAVLAELLRVRVALRDQVFRDLRV